jgi:hypothetical protein
LALRVHVVRRGFRVRGGDGKVPPGGLRNVEVVLMDAGQLRWMIDFLQHEGERQELRHVWQGIVPTTFQGGRVPPPRTHQIQVLGVNHSAFVDLLKARDAVLKRKFLR